MLCRCRRIHHKGLPLPSRVEFLRLAAILPDIGKIYVPAEIIIKPGALSDAEYALMQTHCSVGHDILQHLAAPNPLAEIVYTHHERLDGSGYPRGLSGDQIIMEARILAVADVFDAVAAIRGLVLSGIIAQSVTQPAVHSLTARH